MAQVVAGPGRWVTVAELESLALGGATLALAADAWEAVERCRAYVDRLVADRRLVYGISTGFGPLASRYVEPRRSGELQRNLVLHLASGTGPPLAREQVRALMAARAVSLALGCSGVSAPALRLLIACLNQDLVPEIPSMGTVGASGDLTPLAHLAMAMMGEGTALDRGERRSVRAAFAARDWRFLHPSGRDGLALVNGTAVMTGIAALNAAAAERAARWATLFSLVYTELLAGHLEAFDPMLAEVRPHPGQRSVHEALMALAAGSERLQAPVWPARVLPPLDEDGTAGLHRLPQDPYSARCAPQLIGAATDMMALHRGVVEAELNAVSDNPVFFPGRDRVVHGGNFFGQHVAFAADALGNALIQLAVHSERKIARLTDDRANGGLPAFLAGDPGGLSSGFMGAQVTATAIVAEMRTRALPASVQSIPTNADNQDVVPMGTVAARNGGWLVDRFYDVLAIEALVLVQAMELCGGEGFSPAASRLRDFVRASSSFLRLDRALGPEIGRLARRLRAPGAREVIGAGDR